MGNDLCLAWPSAEIAVMGAKGARRDPAPAGDARSGVRRSSAEYEERLLNPYVAADRGFVDAVIDPADTRREVAAALDDAGHQAREPASPGSTTTRPL